MAEPIGALRAELAANAAQFSADMAQARNAVKTTAAQMQRAFANLQTRANSTFKSIFNLRNALLGGSATAAIMFVRRMADVADELQSTSKALGITAEDLQEVRYAATQLGVTVDGALTKSLGIMVRGMGEAQRGTGNFRKGIAELGLNIQDLQGKGPLEVLSTLANRLSSIEDPAKRATIASLLFGKGWQAMGGFLAQGGVAIDAMREKARALGLIVSNEMVDRAAAAADEFDTLGQVFQVAGINLAAQFLPMLKDVAGVMTSQAFQKGTAQFAGQVRSIVKYIHDNIDVIERFAKAFVGMKMGAALGGVAGKKGRVLGGIIGGGLGFFQEEISNALSETDTSTKATLSTLMNPDLGTLNLAKKVVPPEDLNWTPIDADAAAESEKAIDRVTSALLDEWRTIGLTDVEKEIYNQLTAAGVDANSAAGQTIRALVEANYAQEASEKAKQEALEESIKKMDEVRGIATDFISTFIQARQEGKTFWEAMGEAAQKLADKLIDLGIQQLVAGLFGAVGGPAGGLLGPLFKLFGFAQGGAFRVGGAGGADSQFVAFRASPNETVSVTKPGQDAGPGGGAMLVEVVPSPYFDVRVKDISNQEATKVSSSQLRGWQKGEQRARMTRG